MRTIKNISLALLASISFSFFTYSNPPALSDFPYQSASVMPFYIERKQKYIILAQEEWGRDKGTYDDFGGKRDSNENHPLITATREFSEEAIVNETFGLDLQQTRNFIDIKAKNTHFIIANTAKNGGKHVTYITKINKYKTCFINSFYKARRQATKAENKEKSSLALVQWNDLKNVILNRTGRYQNVWIKAQVIHPITHKKQEQMIQLRPYFVIKLEKFFKGEPYTHGKNKKIRFY